MQNDQLPLFDNPPTGLTCEFGGEWTATGCGPCAGCLAESDRLAAQYRGDYIPARQSRLSRRASTTDRNR